MGQSSQEKKIQGESKGHDGSEKAICNYVTGFPRGECSKIKKKTPNSNIFKINPPEAE